uniref:Uncharacterized protein n=1 Tax=Burkholderia sp. (strain CCGE1003) TaxID=640512 RepID=E1TIG0_BURSG
MNALPNPIFDAWPLQDAAVLMLCISVAVWIAGLAIDLRQRNALLRSCTSARIDHSTGELQ